MDPNAPLRAWTFFTLSHCVRISYVRVKNIYYCWVSISIYICIPQRFCSFSFERKKSCFVRLVGPPLKLFRVLYEVWQRTKAIIYYIDAYNTQKRLGFISITLKLLTRPRKAKSLQEAFFHKILLDSISTNTKSNYMKLSDILKCSIRSVKALFSLQFVELISS